MDASTVTEHVSVSARGHASANAPGRTEGSREHADLAITRRRDPRPGLCSLVGANHRAPPQGSPLGPAGRFE
jgi:hypothetical protein